ncbi:hypothetical protein [Faecalispora anaeroviscerum]|uniref:hypothetical protein n=1 Tax=Faecalispora anaeroviscerum TaxID=2991836 RepID=UPI0024BAFF9A|nr:hypothetical protein [Faecalispora anaeroviscerum]
MHRLSGVALCLTAFLLMWGCAQSLEKEESVTLPQKAEVLGVQSFVQKQPLSAEEVKGIVQGLLDQAKDVQSQIMIEDLSGSSEKRIAAFSIESTQDAMDADKAAQSSEAAGKRVLEGLIPVNSGEYDSAGKIREGMQSVYTPQAAEEYYSELFEGTDPILQEIDGVLYFSQDQTVLSPSAMEYLVDTSVIMRQTVDEITVELTLQTQGSAPMKKSLHLKKQGENWQLDSVVFPQRIQNDGN